MNILMVGSGKGAWAIRGEQLGAALGARVTSSPTEADFGWSDVVVLVKRAGAVFATQAHRAGRPIVWDALDCWSQPADNRLSEPQARQLLQAQIKAIRPTLVIGATQAMAEACDGVFLPHHSWSGLEPTPAREVVSCVGYEGNPAYLGRWRQAIEQECQRRGWMFVLGSEAVKGNGFMSRPCADILVAFRDGVWDGWMCWEWKSGVKVVNAIAAGRPLIAQPSAAVREFEPARSVIDFPITLVDAFDYWAPFERRAAAVEISRRLAPEFTLSAVAERYRQILQSVRVPCAV